MLGPTLARSAKIGPSLAGYESWFTRKLNRINLVPGQELLGLGGNQLGQGPIMN
jgi:hypothetical protein